MPNHLINLCQIVIKNNYIKLLLVNILPFVKENEQVFVKERFSKKYLCKRNKPFVFQVLAVRKFQIYRVFILL